jgi:hypothetical protein
MALWAVCSRISDHDGPQAGGYNILAKRKDALASWVEVLDMFAAIWGL